LPNGEGAFAMPFWAFTRLDGVGLRNRQGKRVTPGDVVDHSSAYSIYFCDPYQNDLEVTTCDYDEASRQLEAEFGRGKE
jgi:hypothetical protein